MAEVGILKSPVAGSAVRSARIALILSIGHLSCAFPKNGEAGSGYFRKIVNIHRDRSEFERVVTNEIAEIVMSQSSFPLNTTMNLHLVDSS